MSGWAWAQADKRLFAGMLDESTHATLHQREDCWRAIVNVRMVHVLADAAARLPREWSTEQCKQWCEQFAARAQQSAEEAS